MNCWTERVTHNAGVATVVYGGLIPDRCLIAFWRHPPVAAAILFDFRAAVIAYRAPVFTSTLDAQRAGPPAAILCNRGDYELFATRADALAALGVRRMVFLNPTLAREWASMQARRSPAGSGLRKRAQDALAAPHP